MPQTNVVLVEIPPSESPKKVLPVWASYQETLRRGLSHQGKVNTRRFWRLQTLGDSRVWRGSPEPTSRIKASALLLFDFSGSQHTFSDILIDSFAAIGAGLSAIGLQTWAAAFTTSTGRDPDTESMQGEMDAGRQASEFRRLARHDHARYWLDENPEVTILAQVSDYGEPFDVRRVWTLATLPMMGTPTPWALGYVRRFVLPTAPLGKRLLVVCTDGQSTDPTAEAGEIARLREDADTLVCGLYMGSYDKGSYDKDWSEVQSLYSPYALHVPNRADLPGAFAQVVGFLRGMGGE